MTGKDTFGLNPGALNRLGAGKWKRLVIGIFPVIAVIATAVVFRTTNTASTASAQAPAKGTAPAGAGAPRAASAGTKRPSTSPPSQARGQTPVPVASGSKTPAGPQALKPTGPMAVVNGEQITRTELGRECIRRYGKEVIETLISKQMISDACAQRGIQITEKDVTEEVERIAQKFGLSPDRWVALLREERGFSEAQYRREVVWPMLALRKVSATEIQVTQDEIKTAFESEYGPKVRARLIICSQKAKAEKALAKAVANPKAFGNVAKEFCEDASVAAASGVIPPISKHTGDPTIEQAAFSLKKGQVSKIIPVADKFVILMCDDQIPEQYVRSTDLPTIERQLKEKISDAKNRNAAAQFMAGLEKNAQVDRILGDAKKQQAQPGVAAIVNGKPISIQQLQEECISRFGGDVLDGEINRKIFTQELARRKLTITQQDIDQEIARAAESYGYLTKDNRPDIERWLTDVTTQDGATRDLYISDAVWPTVVLKKLCGSKVVVTEEDLHKGFESSFGERVEVLAIVVGDQRQAQRVWEMARNNPIDPFFSELAQQYSIEPASRANGGKVPPIRKFSGAKIIEDAAFKLNPGDLSGILAVEDQYIILRCQGRTKPVQTDFASVKNEIQKEIHEKKLRLEMNREFDRLRGGAQIDNYLAGTSQSARRSAPATGQPNASGVVPASATGPRAGAPMKR